MKKIFNLILIALFLTVCEGRAAEQGAPHIPVIGMISQGRGTRNSTALYQGLEELGYVEGKTYRVERRHYKGKRSLISKAAEELVRMKVDVIVPSGPTALRGVLKATKTIPVVMPNAGSDPVGSGFVKSLSEPGGNATGLSLGYKGLGTKRMELLKEILPSVKSVVFLKSDDRAVYLEEYREAARALDVEFEVVDVRKDGDFERAFAKVATKLPDAMIVERNSLTRRHTGEIGEFALKHRVATMNGHRVFVEKGGLISYGVDYTANWRRAAVFIDKILKGADPAKLPVEPPRLELVVNLKTAEQIGIEIRPGILLEAKEVIK